MDPQPALVDRDAVAAVAPVDDDAGLGLGAGGSVDPRQAAGQPDDLIERNGAELQAFRSRRQRRDIGGQVDQGDAVSGAAHFSTTNTSELVEPSWILPVSRLPSSIWRSIMAKRSASSVTGLSVAVWTTMAALAGTPSALSPKHHL